MLIEKRNGSYSVCRIPGMVCTQAGTLLAYYECRNELSDWAQIDLKVIRSTDGGETWQTVKLIEGKGHTLNNPVMVVKEETIHFLYCSDYHELYACRSTDDGLTFTQAEDITAVWADGGRFYNAAAIESVDLLNIVWAMAKNADEEIPEPREWFKQFDVFPVDVIAPAVFELIFKAMVSTKNLKRLQSLRESLQPNSTSTES